jgi:dihydroorotate dehydrogenase (NAD+) catalytic subunit
MAIDIEKRKPVFDNTIAGLSGPAIMPIALRMVWELYDALKEAGTPIPIVGMGGIARANDAVEFLMAGAAAIQVGSATFVNPRTMADIIDGLRQYMKNKGISKAGEISIRETYGKNN